MNQATPTIVRLFALCLTLVVVLIFASGKVSANEVTFARTAGGCFGVGCIPEGTGQANPATLLGLAYNGSIFNGKTSMGFFSIGNMPSPGANIDNLGSFSLTQTAGQTFNLLLTFTAPPGITGGLSTAFTAVLGNVTTTDMGGVLINFNNDPILFTFTNASGTGSFSFGMNDVSVLPGGTVTLSGVITSAQQNFIPEPATLLLVGTGLVGLGAGLRKRYRKAKQQNIQ